MCNIPLNHDFKRRSAITREFSDSWLHDMVLEKENVYRLFGDGHFRTAGETQFVDTLAVIESHSNLRI